MGSSWNRRPQQNAPNSGMGDRGRALFKTDIILWFYLYGPTNTDIQYLYQSNTDILFKIDIQLLLISVSEFKTSINSEGICVVIDSD